jgi:4'-phosphopantetheinyl transferase
MRLFLLRFCGRFITNEGEPMPKSPDSRTWIYQGVADHADARTALVAARLEAVLGHRPNVTRTPLGKPVLAPPDDHLWLSYGSRDGLMVLALSDAGPVGVDMETLASCRDWERVAAAFFSAAERAWLETLADGAQILGFAHLWTGKEAVLKATGQGLAAGLDTPDYGSILTKASLPQSLVVAAGDGTPYTVVWTIHTVEDCLAVAARADAGTSPPLSLP